MAVDLKIFPVAQPEREFLAGAQAGRRFGQELLAVGRELPRPCVFVIDFAGDLMATGSWLREAILRVNWVAHSEAPNLYICIAGCSFELEEELLLLLEATNAVLTVVDLRNGVPICARILGDLADALRDAFDVMCKRGRISATELATGESGLSPSAWNNRLNSLHERRILVTERPGLARYYEPLFRGELYGCRLPLQSP